MAPRIATTVHGYAKLQAPSDDQRVLDVSLGIAQQTEQLREPPLTSVSVPA